MYRVVKTDDPRSDPINGVSAMRAEMQAVADDIRESLALLRRHL